METFFTDTSGFYRTAIIFLNFRFTVTYSRLVSAFDLLRRVDHMIFIILLLWKQDEKIKC